MDIMTLTIVIAGIALALAIESTILHVLGMRRIDRELQAIKEKVDKPHDNKLNLLLDRLTPAGDFLEDQDKAPEESAAETVKAPEEPAAETVTAPEEPAATSERAALKQAYDKYYTRYRALADNIELGQLDEQSEELGALLVEMGLWLKDYLPVSQQDFNATEVQRVNAESVGYDEQRLAAMLAQGKLSNGNPYETPYEVVGLTRLFRRWNIQNVGLLLSGYRYEPSISAAAHE